MTISLRRQRETCPPGAQPKFAAMQPRNLRRENFETIRFSPCSSQPDGWWLASEGNSSGMMDRLVATVGAYGSVLPPRTNLAMAPPSRAPALRQPNPDSAALTLVFLTGYVRAARIC